jgi:hypothetical protein
MKQKRIGTARENDLVLAQPSVADVHAYVELADDGSVYVSSAGAHAPLWLLRGDHRQRAQRICLSLDDRLILGNEEVAVARLTGLFEAADGARLRHRKEAPRPSRREPVNVVPAESNGAPRRNPETGAIEN